jgi:hypothetical protein
MKRTLVISSMIFLLVGCKNSEESLQDQLVGEWSNLSMKITTNSKNNTDSNEVFEVDRAKWEETLKIKPIRTLFRADSTYNSPHFNLKDSLVFNPSGKWWVEGDKVYFLQLFPSTDASYFTLSINKDTATFEGPVDWDEDGKKDDIYFGRQIKVDQQVKK